ncbi:MAG: hypothetical protein IPJ34_17205, partial [Myxococcales bacterium]|nr:hypothetical protein [Myxococcales bacterium]
MTPIDSTVSGERKHATSGPEALGNLTAGNLLALLLTAVEDATERAVRRALAEQCPPQAARLLSRGELAKALGTSLASIDRLVREGLPREAVGARSRFGPSQLPPMAVAQRGKLATPKQPATKTV